METAEISDLSVRVDADKAQTILSLTGRGLSSETVHIFQMQNGAPRLVVDCKSCPLPKLGKLGKSHQRIIKGQGLIKQIRMASRSDTAIRLVLDLNEAPEAWGKTFSEGRVVIKLTGGAADKMQPERADSQGEVISASYLGISNVPVPRLKPTFIKKAKPIIVIDPGHGGHDPGAIGKGGAQEKAITLKAALELKSQLLKTGRYKVILTRGDDRYIKHDERLRIARADGADLFISLHADSASPSARGASVYTLADRAIGRSKHIVDSQNWIMDVDLSEQSDLVGDILVDLAQRKTFSHSTRFADDLIGHLEPKTKLVGNTHRRAGYFVLLAPDVPAVLLELGFISNKDDEKLLLSSRHRRKLMAAVTTAINSYFDGQNP